MANCRDCNNYNECRKMKKIRIEIYNDGWLKQPKLCNYVEHLCKEYKPREKE